MTDKEIKILRNNHWSIDNLSSKCRLIEYDTSNGFTCQIKILDGEQLCSVIQKEYQNFNELHYVEDWKKWIKENPSCWHTVEELEISAKEQKQALKELLEELTAKIA